VQIEKSQRKKIVKGTRLNNRVLVSETFPYFFSVYTLCGGETRMKSQKSQCSVRRHSRTFTKENPGLPLRLAREPGSLSLKYEQLDWWCWQR
jgi:hypothetical protein